MMMIICGKVRLTCVHVCLNCFFFVAVVVVYLCNHFLSQKYAVVFIRMCVDDVRYTMYMLRMLCGIFTISEVNKLFAMYQTTITIGAFDGVRADRAYFCSCNFPYVFIFSFFLSLALSHEQT